MNIFDILYSGVKNKPDTPFWKERSIKHGEFKIHEGKKKWVPFYSAKRELINHIFGRNVEYFVQSLSDPFIGKDFFNNNNTRITYQDSEYDYRDLEYLYTVLTERHKADTLGKKGEKWHTDSVIASVPEIEELNKKKNST